MLDASVAAKWFNNEALTEKAIEVRDAFVRRKIELYAPEHLLYEVGNSMWKNSVISAQDAENAIRALVDMDIDLVKLDPDSASEAMKIARELGISYYDALYVQLSDSLSVQLLTADAKLASNVKEMALPLKDLVF